ncbi:hypothetical protein BHM03_00000798 [Ensete ventricosum]|nr:hypothetical protein BHM03_00000798 [Ensete ventricosum]
MDLKQAGSSLDALVSSFHTRIVELQELVIARNSSPFPTSSSLFPLVPDDSGLDILHEPCHLKEEPVAIPKGKKCTSPAPRWYISAEELDSLSSLLKTPGKRLFVTKWTNSRNCDSQVLRHLGRILEARIGHHRVFTLSKPH